MTRIRRMEDIDTFVPTVEQVENALNQLVQGKYSLHVPPEFEDADIVLGCVIREWKRLKDAEGKRSE